MNKVVARFTDGHMVKGMTSDFVPSKDRFHVTELSAGPGAKPTEIETKALKALFFVRDFGGRTERGDRNAFDPGHPVAGRRIRVEFKDGEVLIGTTQGYQAGRPGFFLVPANPGTNTERCYVVTAAAADIRFV